MPKDVSDYKMDVVFDDRIENVIKKNLDEKGKQSDYLAFAERLFSGVPTGELDSHSDDNIIALIAEAYGFLKDPLKAKHIKVSLSNPDFTRHSLAMINIADQPFLLDSIGLELNRRGIDIHHTFHPLLDVQRTDDGAFKCFEDDGNSPRESLIIIEFDRQDVETLKDIKASLKQTITLAQQVVKDFGNLTQKMHHVTRTLRHAKSHDAQEDMIENVEFLEWLLDDHFVFLGYRQYDLDQSGEEPMIKTKQGEGLGILRGDKKSSLKEATKLKNISPNLQLYMNSPQALTLTKAITKANIHRHVDMDYIGVKEFDDKGRVIREHRFVGLFTSKAYTCSVRDIPLVRKKINAVLQAEKDTRGHNYRGLVNILETYPREELFQISVEDLHRIALGILHLKDRQKTRLLVRRGAEDRLISAMVFLPRDHLTRINRNRITKILEKAFDAEDISYNIHVGDAALARIFFMVRTVKDPSPAMTAEEAEQEIIKITSSWEDSLRKQLTEQFGEHKGIKLANTYNHLFPIGYQDHTPEEVAADDIRHIEMLCKNEDPSRLAVSLHITGKKEGQASLRIFRREKSMHLSDIMPILEKMGLYVHEEHPNAVEVHGQKIWVHDFTVQAPENATRSIDDQTVVQRITNAIQLAWCKEMEIDSLGNLITHGNLGVEAIIILRAYVAYIKQIGSKYSSEYVRRTLVKHPKISGRLWKLFDARFNPDYSKKAADAAEASVCKLLEDGLKTVAILDEDLIIRRLIGLIKATKRTNAFARSCMTDPLALKFFSAEVPDLPKPAPLYEIFIYHVAVEGIHLRGGKVARGGLRWSDREADFRTEVLGLMKTQMTKNAVIVPVGSKGGFVLKKAPCNLKDPATCNADDLKQAVADAYKIFVRHILCVTDNIENDKIVPPDNVRRHDEDDPYLVVAADKGTATFSDLANSISKDADFWLGDAFASGGSNGYDHKKMGITARGAWESVKRHFNELGKDIQKEPFTCFGIGDMGGDVFGNGMLLSKQIKLVAAFNHMHIFIDPDPNPETTYTERKRLFDEAKGWGEYDKRKLSKGGDIYSRADKEITLSAEAKQLLGLRKDKVAPDELMTAILSMKAELFWNGGIGTFVKAETESHMDVGDRANDAIRINGNQLRAKVVGEGGNLGMTQCARIEAARHGVLLNTDAVDNSGGVDCSDHEVNIKILLDKAVSDRKIKTRERNDILTRMTDDVADLVLENNIRQSQLISFERNLRATASADAHLHMMRVFEKQGLLDRSVEFLPGDEEMAERIKDGQGLTRPELSVLMAYSKMDLYNNLVSSDLPDEPGLDDYLEGYFPPLLREKMLPQIKKHPLRREIITTVLTNEMINRMGLSFIYRLRNETGYKDDTIARAFVVVKKLYGLDEEWQRIDTMGHKVSALTQLKMLDIIRRLSEHACLWFLRHGPTPLRIEEQVKAFGPVIRELIEKLPQHMTTSMARHYKRRVREWGKLGLSGEEAEHMALAQSLYAVQDIAQTVTSTGKDPEAVMRLHFSVGEQLEMELLHTKARNMPNKNYWERVANQAIIDSLYGYQKEAALQAIRLANGKSSEDVSAIMKKWNGDKKHELVTFKEMVRDLDCQDHVDHAMLNVVIWHLKTITS
mgnify:CR=1 FL=1